MADESSDARSASAVIASVLGPALAGLGVVAFVAAAGGVITQARLRGAGLPSAIGVSMQSQGQLLAVGGEVLSLVLIVALVIVMVVHQSLGWQRRTLPWHLTMRTLFVGFVWLTMIVYYVALTWAQRTDLGMTHLWITLVFLPVSFLGAYAAGIVVKHVVDSRERQRPPGRPIDASGDATAASPAPSQVPRPVGEASRLFLLFGVISLTGAFTAVVGNLANPRSVRSPSC